MDKGTGSYCCHLGERSGDIAWAGAGEVIGLTLKGDLRGFLTDWMWGMRGVRAVLQGFLAVSCYYRD